MAIIEDGMSRNLSFKVVLKGNNGPKNQKTTIIGNDTEWKEFFDGKPPQATADFSKGFIVAIALGEMPSTGYSIDVKSVYQITIGITSGSIDIDYIETTPEGLVGEQMTSPYIIIRILDTQYATRFFFKKLEKKYIVIAYTGSDTGCQTIPEDSLYTEIHSRVFGPATLVECNKYIQANCKG